MHRSTSIVASMLLHVGIQCTCNSPTNVVVFEHAANPDFPLQLLKVWGEDEHHDTIKTSRELRPHMQSS